MKQGEKHRTALAVGSSLAIVACAAALLPAAAGAAPAAQHEYELGDLPQAGGDNDTSASGANSTSDGDTTSDTPAIPGDDTATGGSDSGTTSSGGDDSTGSAGGGDDKRGGDDKGSPGTGSAKAGQAIEAPEAIVPAVTAASSDDGGAPVVLIALALIAATCTGFAIYRMRSGSAHPGSSESKSD